jgi:hypothetical protein
MVTLIEATTVSDGWIAAARAAREAQGQRIFHLVVAIEEPLAEDPGIRAEVETLLTSCRLQPVGTVANTIFPDSLARISTDHADLVRRYREIYPRITKFSKNRWGTYFGRLVAYPLGSVKRPAPVDQLGPIIGTLTRARVISAEYEAAVMLAGDTEEAPYLGPTAATVCHPTRGPRGRGGPCLSHIAFQRDGNVLHAVAHYRSQYLIERAYGNYLGLGQLLGYIAEQADLSPGTLTIVAGYAQLDQSLRQVDRALAAIAANQTG